MFRNLASARKAIAHNEETLEKSWSFSIAVSNAPNGKDHHFRRRRSWAEGNAAPTEIKNNRLERMSILEKQYAIEQAKYKMKASGGWKKRVFGIGPQHAGLPGSRLIHPFSPFWIAVTTISATLLIYTGVVSSFTVGFLWNQDPCTKNPNLEFDMFVDTFFIAEILLNFLVGFMEKGEYKDDFRKTVSHYLRTGFFFDLVTSVPVSYYEYALYKSCRKDSSHKDYVPASFGRVLRSLKPLRIARLLKTLKFGKVLDLLAVAGEYFRLPPFALRMIKTMLFICLLVHVSACCFWLIKELTNTNEQRALFLERNNLANAGLFDRYVLSFYFVNTVFCTIGFGDISGDNAAERIFCVALFYCGVLIFGTLLAEVQDAVQRINLNSRERENEIGSIVEYLREEDVPHAVEKKIVRWADFMIRTKQVQEARNRTLQLTPANLHNHLVLFLQHDLLMQIPMFQSIRDCSKENLLVDLWSHMTTKLYAAFVPVATSRHTDLYIIVSGTVILVRDNEFVSTFHPGDYFGERSLLSSSREGGAEDEEVDSSDVEEYVAITLVHCYFLSKESFEYVLSGYPDSIRQELLSGVQQRKQEEEEEEELCLNVQPDPLPPHLLHSDSVASSDNEFDRSSSAPLGRKLPAEEPWKEVPVRRWQEMTLHMLRKNKRDFPDLQGGSSDLWLRATQRMKQISSSRTKKFPRGDGNVSLAEMPTFNSFGSKKVGCAKLRRHNSCGSSSVKEREEGGMDNGAGVREETHNGGGGRQKQDGGGGGGGGGGESLSMSDMMRRMSEQDELLRAQDVKLDMLTIRVDQILTLLSRTLDDV
eukprot:764687-Hanusia_phi.AAC.5